VVYVQDEERTQSERRAAARWVERLKAGHSSIIDPWSRFYNIKLTEDDDRELPFLACSRREAFRRTKAGFREPEEEREMLTKKTDLMEE